MSGSLSVEALQADLASAMQPLEDSESVPLRQALNRVLSADLISPIDIPGHANSAMDGWALDGSTLGPAAVRLKQVGIAYAGHPHAGRLAPGECVRIMTGAMVPEGADTVVMQEVVQAQGEEITFPPGPRRGENVRLAGEDLARGELAIPKGTRLRPAHIGLAASLGLTRLKVKRRLRVAVFSTGDELRTGGETLEPGAIYDSNRAVLLGMLEQLGIEASDLGLVRDDIGQLDTALHGAMADADVILTSGGVSMGDADPVRLLLAGLGDVRFCKVDLRPGRPFAYGRLHKGTRSSMLFALPGNPVAAVVSFMLFVRPALLQMMDCCDTRLPVYSARAALDMKKKPGRTEYQRGILARDASGLSVRLTGAQGSGMLSSLCQADCLVVLEAARGNVRAGEWVDVIPVGSLF